MGNERNERDADNEISFLACFDVRSVNLPEPAKGGRLSPITVRSQQKRVTISGHAAFSDDGLVFMMLVIPGEPSVEFEGAIPDRRSNQRKLGNRWWRRSGFSERS
jgi:hypothetical protein